MISTLLSKGELQRLLLSGFGELNSSPKDERILERIEVRCKMWNIKDASFYIDYFKDVLTFHNNSIFLSDFMNQDDALRIITDILPLCPFVNSLIVVSSISFDPFVQLAKFAEVNCNIEYFRIEGPVTSTFNNFIKYIVNNREQPISGLAFDGTNLDDTTMRELTQVIYSKPIESTGFRNVIRDTTVDASYNIFLPGHVGKTLKCICIDSAPDIK